MPVHVHVYPRLRVGIVFGKHLSSALAECLVFSLMQCACVCALLASVANVEFECASAARRLIEVLSLFWLRLAL